MFTRVRAFVDAWIPPFHVAGDKEASLVHRYYQFLCSIIAGFFVIFASHSAYLGITKIALAQVGVIAVILLSTFVYRKTRSITIAVNIIMSMTAPITFYRAMILGGLSAPMVYGWPVISTLALMTLPMSWTILWTAVHLGFTTYFYVVEASGGSFPITGTESVVSSVRLAMICTVQVILLFSVYLVRRLNSQLRGQLREQSDQAMNVVRTLSHDLSSPLMTMTFWTRAIQKKNLHPEVDSVSVLATLQGVADRMNEIRTKEAEASGKAGGARPEDPETHLAGQLFRFTIYILFAVFTSLAVYYAHIGALALAGLQMAVVVAAALGWTIYRKSGSVFWASCFILFLGSISGFFRARMMGGIASPAFLVWPIIPVFTGILLPFRAAASWTALYVGMAIYYDVMARLGVVYESQISAGSLTQIRIVVLFTVQVMVIVAIYYLKSQNRIFRELIDEQRERRLELLKLLTKEVGVPLRALKAQLARVSDSETIQQVRRSLTASLEIVEHTETWVSSADSTGREIVDLREVIDEVAFLQRTALENKNITWSVHLDSGAAPLVKADRVCVSYQILNNLVSNSIKFTGEGGRISLALRSGADHWDVEIADSGIGIPAALISKLFDLHSPTTRNGTAGEKGTGFGMPIVKMFMEKYQGTIHVESKSVESFPDDHGTMIRLRFPAASLGSVGAGSGSAEGLAS